VPKHYALKHTGGVQTKLHTLTLCWMELSGHLHALVTSPPRKNLQPPSGKWNYGKSG